jgi:hypothetical protein
MKLVIIALSLISTSTSTSASAADYAQFYLVNGAKVSAETAILASMKGTEAYKCNSVEFKVSKAGTSIGIRNVKKPKAN